ncbi:MAG: glucuronate isomerase [Treponemataceae bacterium]|nr:glucuronate isomerase [Treponemataceae bacterium]
MKKFMDQDFLLETDTAKALFNAIKDKPIWDYHCHLIPQQIADNKKFDTITDIWLGGDHYKWRQMRTFGIEEKLITGDADPYDKFMAWTKTVQNLIGNPLYHWTHLELQRYFGIYEPLTEKTAPAIYKKANEMLATDDLSVKGILNKFNVYAVGTTDDPVDDLACHSAIASGTAKIGTLNTKVVPSFRPDKAIHVDAPVFKDYIAKLAEVSGEEIHCPKCVVRALEKRLDYFIEKGCRASDHALEYPPMTAPATAEAKAEELKLAKIAFDKAMAGEKPAQAEADAYRSFILCGLAAAYRNKNVAMQLHIAAIRNNNPSMMAALGPDTGYDGSHDKEMSAGLASLLGRIEEDGGLPKTIIYTLNPKDYYAIGTLIGCFQGAGVKGKIQMGSAWWFCDHKDGMEEQMKVLGNLGMLSCFVGMLTDSRSFLSYPRHEYFRRIMCNLIGGWVENGMYPADMEQLEKIVSGIAFDNVKAYLA